MKRIEEQSYYEILEVSSNATVKEIQRAYEHAQETYHRDSLAIYSLFSEEEVNQIQAAIEEAYRGLIDEALRRSYDQSLLRVSGGPKGERPPEVQRISQEKEASLLFTALSIHSRIFVLIFVSAEMVLRSMPILSRICLSVFPR